MKTGRLTTSPTWLWLSLLMIIAAALRLGAAPLNDSLWFDEAVSYLAASLPLASIIDNTVQSSHPPLYYLLLHVWLPLSTGSDLIARLPGILFNLLLIPAIYLLARELFTERRIAFLAAVLVTVSPFHVQYSLELRMYTLLMLLTTLLAWAYLRARRNGRSSSWLLFVLLATAALYTHLFAALPLIAIGLHALWHYKERRPLVSIVVAGAIITLLFLPWITVLVRESQQDLGSLRPLHQANLFNPLKLLTSPTFLLFGLSNTLVYSGLALFLTLTTTLILLIDIRKARHSDQAQGLGLPLLITATALGLPLITYMVRPFFLPERTMAAASPFMLILLAWGVTRRRSPLPYLAYAAATVMFAGSLIYLSTPAGAPPFGKPPYRDVMAHVASQYVGGDLVLHTSDGSYLPGLRYVDWANHAVLAGDPDPRKPDSVYEALGGQVWTAEELAAHNGRLWLIVALEHSREWQQQQVAFFDQQFPLLDQHEIGGIIIYLYDLPPSP